MAQPVHGKVARSGHASSSGAEGVELRAFGLPGRSGERKRVTAMAMQPDVVPRERGLLRRMTVTTAWGEGLDGYDLGVLSVVLPLITVGLGVSPVWAGLIGASALIGIFFGAPIAGFYLTDRFGRRRVFLIDVVLFVVLGTL
jgi:MFS transporter, putative metabolite transport protein